MPKTIEQLLRYSPVGITAVPATLIATVEDDLPLEPSISLARLRLYYLQTQVLRWILEPKLGNSIHKRLEPLLRVSAKIDEQHYITTISWPGCAVDIPLRFVFIKDHKIEIIVGEDNPHALQQRLQYLFLTNSLQLLECHNVENVENGVNISSDLRYFLYQFFRPATHNFPVDLVFQKIGNTFDHHEFIYYLNAFKNRSLISLFGFLRNNAQDLESDGCSLWVKIPGSDHNHYIQVDLCPGEYLSNMAQEKHMLPESYCGKFFYNFIYVFDWNELTAAHAQGQPPPQPILILRCDIEGRYGEIFELKKSVTYTGKQVMQMVKLFYGIGIKKYYLNDDSKLNDIPLHVIRALSGQDSLYVSLGFTPATILNLHAHDQAERDLPLKQNKIDYYRAVEEASKASIEMIEEFLEIRMEKKKKENYLSLADTYLKDCADKNIGILAKAVLSQSKQTQELNDMRSFVEILYLLIHKPTPKKGSALLRQLVNQLRTIEKTRFFVLDQATLAPHQLVPHFENDFTSLAHAAYYSFTISLAAIGKKLPDFHLNQLSQDKLQTVSNNIQTLLEKMQPVPSLPSPSHAEFVTTLTKRKNISSPQVTPAIVLVTELQKLSNALEKHGLFANKKEKILINAISTLKKMKIECDNLEKEIAERQAHRSNRSKERTLKKATL